MNENVLEIKNISKSFKGNSVLKDISLRCESGKIYGIVGYNGSGKTVLFKCICGFNRLDTGCILLNGKSIGKDIDMLTNAGIIIEEPGYLGNFSGLKNLEFLYRIKNKKIQKNCRIL